ncbi:MAG: putative ABC transporter ATP-binding protein YbhF [Candidatus Thorarchaeota archaeon AB_25]|nr:MAG: putative ABC transporter ATP-binding protein YbhF [Candidatus Thorarchaeota archaeon AB_25]
MRIAIVDKYRCRPKDCSHECQRFCPRVRTGDETVIFPEGPDKPPVIVESLCSGEAICVKKCPYNVIRIVNLPEELESDTSHRFSVNGFKLFRLPTPKEGQVLGLIGPNGVGKTTAVQILAGEMTPNLGRFDDPPGWDEIIPEYRGSELQPFFEKIQAGSLVPVLKPQNITDLPKVKDLADRPISDLLEASDSSGRLKELRDDMSLNEIWDRPIKFLSGGELQRVAVTAAIVREGDIYFFDEPTAYLDVRERLRMARAIRNLSSLGKTIIVVEHDLSILDYVSDLVCMFYGNPGVYGIVSHPHGTRVGVNIFLDGFIPDENMRFRETAISFKGMSADDEEYLSREAMVEYGNMKKSFEDFSLEVKGGRVSKGQIVGILGANGIGKTTFVRMLAGELDPDEGEVPTKTVTGLDLKISYKPQYIPSDFDGSLRMYIREAGGNTVDSADFKTSVIKKLELEHLLEHNVQELSGGELQRAAIAACLAREADIYLFDEPSAFLDIEQRLASSRAIRRLIRNNMKTAFIVEHSILMADYLSDSLVVFGGVPGKSGVASSVRTLRSGMNMFLKEMAVTFRRDPQTGRPRVNKDGSQLDSQQKASGEYYYIGKGK